MKTAAEKAIDEQSYLYRKYRAAQKANREKLHQQYPDLAAFARQLQRYTINDAGLMLAYVREMARGWLATAEPEARHEALTLVSDRIITLRTRAGLPPFDDPILDEPDRIFQAIRRELG